MKNTNFRTFATTFLTIFAVIFGLTMTANAAVKPDLMSKAPNGDNGNGTSQKVSVSGDGRFVVFESVATNLVSGVTDTNAAQDIFLRDTQTGTLRCISLATPTTTGNSFSVNPIISANGRYVVFASRATNLVSVTDNNNDVDVFRFDIFTNQIQLVSINVFGTFAGNSFSGNTMGGWHAYDMSDDGRYVAFMSNASDIIGVTDTNGKSDIFIRDMQTGFTRLASINSSGTNSGNNDSVDPSITADGQMVAFTSLANNLITLDDNQQYDIYVYNYQTQITKCASIAASGTSTGTFSSFSAVISKNGARVAYSTAAHDLTNIPIPFNNPFVNVVVHDLGLGLNSLVSVNTAGTASGNGETGQGSFQVRNVSISANGRYVSFESRSNNLVSLPVGPISNVYRRDLAEGKTEIVSINAAGTQGGSGNSLTGSRGNQMSRDGRFVTFVSNASNLVSDFPISGSFQIYVRDMVNKITTVQTLDSAGTALGNSDSDSPNISANGKAVVFTSFATNLTPTNANNTFNVFKAFVPTPQNAVADFDGDGRTDYSVFRPSSGAWYFLNSDATFASYRLFGTATDTIAPADYSGDGRTDYAVFRPSNGTWYISDGLDFSETITQFGQSGDKPMPQDFDGDGKADLAVYRGGNWFWQSSQNGQTTHYQFGLANDIPVQGDFDGDGKADYSVFRPSNGTWYIRKSTNGSFLIIQFGLNGDKPVAADYDGDGKTDIAVYRNGTWYILRSTDNSVSITQFGLATDIPSVGSYDGDGKADIAVWRPSDGTWYILRSSNGAFQAAHFGQNGDKPVSAAFIQ